MKKLSFNTILSLFFLGFAVVFNLWLYRLEPTATIDPNDNTFQFALIDRTNQIFNYAQQTCSWPTKPFCTLILLADHWVPNWAQGYNLPYYYSHVPQIAIVLTWRILHIFLPALTLFAYYHIVIYLLLSLFPVSVFLALRALGMTPLAQGIGAVIATQLSTDGLYGLDPPSFLWRGYGLSSQLFAMIWLPLAVAYGYRYLTATGKIAYTTRDLLLAIFFLTTTTAGHLGIGVMAFMTIGMLGVAPSIHALFTQDWKALLRPLKETVMRLGLMFGFTGFLLSYWILPILLHGNYHNISYWDPVWKFDSYGAKEIIIRLFNGDLFDFGRYPLLTYLAILGVGTTLLTPYFRLSYLFVGWLLLYFGRTTWGGLIDLIPGMSEFHLSRFIVGLHLSGIFLIPLAIQWIHERLSQFFGQKHAQAIALALGGILLVAITPQTIRYAAHNDVLIRQANGNAAKADADTKLLFAKLEELLKANPGRVFAGRGGGWGRAFQIAETPYYMHLSTYGIPTVLWLPETWSPNSDIEQYFSEDQAKDYVLFNIRYVVAPPTQAVQPFWKPVAENPSWRIYEVATDGYITTGVRPAVVSADKKTYVNVVRLWIQSDLHQKKLYPELTFDRSYPKNTGLPNFRMTDEATYRIPDGSSHSLFAEVPRYIADTKLLPRVISQTQSSDMKFQATVEVPQGCTECLVILRQSAHPGWQATVDGKPTSLLTVFPFYSAIHLDAPGTHEITFTYRPSYLKQALMMFAIAAVVVFVFASRRRQNQ